MSLRPFRRVAPARSGQILAAALALSAAPVIGATWTWSGGTGDWSTTGNWDPATVPVSAVTTELVFGDAQAFVATNNLGADLVLNSLVLRNAAAAESAILAAGAEKLEFSSGDVAGGVPAFILQNGTGDFHLGTAITAIAPLHFGGTGTGITRLTGTISGNGGLYFEAGLWQMSGVESTFTGGVTVNAGAHLELRSITGPVNLARTPASPGLLGLRNSNPVVINGGTLKVTTLGVTTNAASGASIAFGSGNAASFAITFGASGGIFDLTNTNPSAPDSHAGTIGWKGANFSGGDVVLNLSNTAPAIVRFNGGQLGLSGYDDPGSGGWSIGQNALRFRQYSGAGPLRIELSHGAMARAGTGADNAVEILAPVTYRGEVGGDPTSGPGGIANPATGLNTGRLAVDRSSVNHSGGLIFEDALQIATVNGASRLAGNILLAGTATGHPATVTFSGRSTSNFLRSDILDPQTAGEGQNPLWLGDGSGVALTIQDGATAIFDARIRTDQANHSGVVLDGIALLEAGGTLRIAQSVSSYSPFARITLANVGDIILRGSVEGQGSTAAEAVLDLRLPAPDASGTILNGIPTPLATTAPGGGTRPHGGLVAEGTHQLIINGTGFGGLRLEANARPDALFSTSILPGNGASTPDPVSSLAKLAAYLTSERLEGLTGSGGYLTVAPAGETWSFPAGGEWLDAVAVGLRATNHRADGADLSLAGVTAFRHNLAVDAGATIDFGAQPFTFGPATATAGIGTLHGNGSVQAPGGLTVTLGGTVAPGLGGIGKLTADRMQLAGTLEIETNAAAADLLAVTGALVLDATSQLSVPAASVLGARNYKVATAETLTGTFGAAAGLGTTHTVSYTRPGEIWLAYTGGPSVTWTGDANGDWDQVSLNWTGPTAFTEGDRVIFGDAGPVARRTVTVAGGDVAPASIEVDTTGSYTLISSAGAAIVGTGELVKRGSGTLILAGPAAFEGGVLIEGGTVETASADAIPDAGKVVVSAGAQLELGGAETIGELIVGGTVLASDTLTVGVLRLNSASAFEAPLRLQERMLKDGAPLSLPQPIDFDGGVRGIDVATAGGALLDLTFAGALSNGGFRKTGEGTLLLAAANELQAGIEVEGGTVRAGVLGAMPSGTNVAVGANGALDLNGMPHSLGALTTSGAVTTGGATLTVGSLAGLGGMLNLGGGALHVNQSVKTRYDGDITTSGALTKTGAGSLALGGANAFGGGIQLNEGILRIAGDDAAGMGGINVAAGGTLVAEATISTPVTIAGGTLGARYEEIAIASEITFAAGTTSTVIIADPEEQSFDSEVVITGIVHGSGDIFVQGADNFDGSDRNQGLRFRGTAASDYSGTITAGQRVKLELQTSQAAQAGAFSPIGAGKIVLTAGSASADRNGTYSQLNLRNNTAGDVVLGTDVVIEGSGLVNFGPVSDTNAPAFSRIILGNLRIGGGQEASVNKNLAVPQVVEFSTVTLTGGEAVFSPERLGFGFNQTSSLALGSISELAAGSGIIMRGQADLFLAGANSYTGRTAIESGATWLAAEGALPAATALELNGGKLLFQSPLGPSFNQSVASLSGGLDGTIDNTAAEVRDFTVNQASDTVFGGRLQGNLNLIKLGPGTLSLTGSAAHNGATTIGAGAISLSSGGAQGSISGSVVVQSGALLTGAGSVGELTVQAGGRVEPGEGAGILSADVLTFAEGSVLAFDLNGPLPGFGHDRIDVFSSLTLEGAVQLELQLGFQPGQSDVFTLILNNGGDAVSGPGRFVYAGNTLENGEIFSVATGAFRQEFEIRYDANGGHEVVLNAVPEPATAGLLICGAFVCGRRRRVR